MKYINNTIYYKRLAIIILFICVSNVVFAKKINSRHYKFKITIPDQMVKINDTNSYLQNEMYYDSVADVIVMISARDSKFKSVKDYMDCSTEKLEEQLKSNYEDNTLKLISCSRSIYYPENTTLLNFQVSIIPFDYNLNTVYFIFHRRKDIQIFFSYKKGTEQQSLNYINTIMKTLKLK